MTEEEELKEAFPEEIDYDPNSSDNYEPPDVYSLQNEIIQLHNELSDINKELRGLIDGDFENLNNTKEEIQGDSNKIKKAIAQIIISDGGNKSNG